VADQLGELLRLLSDLANAGRRELSDHLVRILEFVNDLGEDLVLDDVFSQLNRVAGDVREARAHLPLQLGIVVGDQGRQEGH